MEKMMLEYFEELETEQGYNWYYYNVAEAVTLVVLGSLFGLKNVSQVHQWTEHDKTRKLLRENFLINRVPCHYGLMSLLKMVKPESLNQCLIHWAASKVPANREGLTMALDGKTVCSTEKMRQYWNPLHIVNVQLSELAFASESVSDKSSEIPAAQELFRELDITSYMVVADALNCQKETAQTIIGNKGGYLLSVKANHPTLM